MRIPRIKLPRPHMPELGMPSRATAWRYGRVGIGVAVFALVIAILPGNTKKSDKASRLGADDETSEIIPGVVGPDGQVVTTDSSTPPTDSTGAVPGKPGTTRATGKAAVKTTKGAKAAAKGGSGDRTGGSGGTSGTAGGSGGTAGGSGGGAGGSGAGGGSDGGGTSGGGAGGGPGGAGGGAAADCRSDGRMAGFSLYMPPCVPLFSGDNGGATSQGVGRDKIVIVRYVSQLPPGLAQLMQGLGADDGEAKNAEMDAALVDFFNDHMETYGREVVMVTKQASGTDDQQDRMRADAKAIVDQHHPFAVIHTQPGAPDPVFARTLAENGVVCICAITRSRSLYRETAPYVWSTQPILEDFYQATAEYVGDRLAGKTASFAGDLSPDLKSATRKFGLIYVNGQSTPDPTLEQGKDFYREELRKRGVPDVEVASYLFSPETMGQFQNVARNIIAQMKDKKVSNVLCACDPFAPIFLTQEATRAGYFPEWLINGIGFSEVTFFGRTRDQAQWEHAFGIGAFPVPSSTFSATPAYKAFAHMRPGASPGKAITARQWAIQMLFTGIHMAGPNLSPQSFAQGMFNFPRTGGQPKFPLVYYTPDSPAQAKDFTEIFWDARGAGQDEAGNQGTGVMMRAEGGRRYQFGQWGRRNPSRGAAVYASDNPPESLPHDADGHRHPATQKCRSC